MASEGAKGMTKSRHDGGFLAGPLLYRAIRPAVCRPWIAAGGRAPKPPRHKNLVRGSGAGPRRGDPTRPRYRLVFFCPKIEKPLFIRFSG